MTIKLTSDIRHGGAIVPANTTVTYDPAVEADLVARKSATYVGAPATTDLGVPAMVKQNLLTGGIKSISAANGARLMSGPGVRVGGDRMLKASGAKLLCDGVEVREMGVCASDLLTAHILGTSQKFVDELPQIAQAGFRFVRVMGGPLWPSEWTSSYGANKTRYFARVKQFLDCAAEHKIGIVLSLFWRHATQADLASESVNAGLGTSGSATRVRCATIIQEYAERFAGHPAVAAWEVGNEYSLFAANGSLPTANAGNGTPASYSSPADVLTLESMRSFYTFFAQTVQQYDTTGRLILSGNGGPGGVIEKTLDNYKTIVPLDNPAPMNSISIHKYARNEFGNRAYADLTDTLIELRKLSDAAGKPFILGEFGSERNETYGGYGGDTVFATACEAVYRSGIPLAFAWNWNRNDSTVATNNLDFHPLNTVNATNKKLEILRRYHDLMRMDGTVSSAEVAAISPVVRGGQAVEVDGQGLACLLSVADNAALKPAGGFAVSFWCHTTLDGLINRRIARKYGGNAGWYIGLDGNSPSGVTGQVQYSDGSTQSLGGQAPGQAVADGWHHYIIQLNATAGQATSGLTLFVDGRWVKTLALPGGKTWNPSTDSLLFFGDAGPSSVSYTGLKDFRLHNRALTDVEARALYLYDITPVGTVVGEWAFNGGYADTSGNSNNATVTSGTPSFVAFPK
ncbi:MAG: cellulase family glycosylhydrolase [Candidatus Accumulibacter sp.]|nr:cellulase family glycosylhydrolase [Accumulibacter sp.]